MWTRRRTPRASRISSSIAACSLAAAGCRARSRSAEDRLRRPARASSAGSSACASSGKTERGEDRQRVAQDLARLTCSNSSTPDGQRKHLKPEHAGATRAARAPSRCRARRRPRSPTSTWQRPAAAPRFASSPSHGRRRRNAVERHVDERRHAAGGGRARRVLEAFPLGAARIVDVDVRVDEAREHDERTGVDARARRPARRRVLADRGDPAVAHVDRGRPNAVRQHDPLARDESRVMGRRIRPP